AVGIAGRKIADARTARGLLAGRMNNGSPLAVPGGYVEGQRVSTEPPTQRPLSEQDVNQLTRTRRLAGLIKSGRVIQNPDKSFSVKLDDYEPLGIYQQVPIGSTPIPPATVQEMKENGSLATLEKKGVIYQNANGNYFNKEPLYARVELYGHPDVAGYIRDSMIGDYEPNTTGKFAALGKTYDYLQKNMKSLLIAWSPFHRGTEAFRILNTLGLKEGGKNIFVPPPDVDYFNLSPQDKFAINSGIVISNPRGYSPSNVKSNTDISEGLGVTADTWGAKAYSAFNKILEKIGVPASVRSKIDPQKILTTDVFGPNGQITKYKFAAFKNLQPAVETAMEKLHPDWTPEQLRAESG
ncbi:MAG: hypothetical protein ACREQ5_37080, partial [Candidatus Dormibacteria bacterium]